MRYRGFLVGDGRRFDLGTVDAKWPSEAHRRISARHERFLRKLQTALYVVEVEPDREDPIRRQRTPTPHVGDLF